MRLHWIWPATAALLLAACAGTPLQSPAGDGAPSTVPGAGLPAEGTPPSLANVPVAPGAAPAGTFPLGSAGTAEPEPLPPVPPAPAPPPLSTNAAVVALLDRAHADAEGGRREAAGAALERALRIEPRNGWVWHELAQVRLALGKYAQAISLAQKSNSFARDDRRLQSFNWRVIGDAQVALGRTLEAEQAFSRADELLR